MKKPKSLKDKMISIKLTATELKQLKKMAVAFGDGNLSDYLRKAGLGLLSLVVFLGSGVVI